MICTIFRPKRTKNGKAQVSRLYRGRYRLEGDTKLNDVPLHTSDKRVAQQRLEQIVRDKQMEQAGMIAPQAVRNAAQSPLEGHLKQYVADLRALNRDGQYVNELQNRVLKLIRDCGWELLRDVTADSFQTWRAKQNRSPKTLNEYLASVSSLLSWMEKHERIAKNPLKHVQKVQTNGKQVRPRRAFADDEMRRLLAVAGPRKALYLTAALTGLRRSELAQLEHSDIHFEAETPFLNVRASTTKNHKQAVIALHPDVKAELNLLVKSLPSSETRVFAHLMPSMDRFRADLKAAGVEFINEKGLRADFHSLRYTLATNLARAGTAPRVAMEIMRHSDMRLTAKTYTDAGLLPIADAVLNLPSLVKPEGTDSQIDSQGLFRAGHDTSSSDTKSTIQGFTQLIGIQKDTLEQSCPDKTGHEKRKSGQNRIRTCEGKARRFTVFPRWPLGYLPGKRNGEPKSWSRSRQGKPASACQGLWFSEG
jgi:integrase